MSTLDQKAAEELARDFHETYERLATKFGYETRPETRDFDPESANGKLMIAVCAELQAARRAQVADGKGWGTSGTSMIDGHDVAAPVQMPHPAGVVTGKLGTSAFVAGPNLRKGEKIYTEHQVRQLLAAHGIK